MRFAFLLLLCATSVYGADSEIMASTNRFPWKLGSTAGVRGGIPAHSTIYRSLSSSTNTAAITTSALGSCPSNQIVKLLKDGPHTWNATVSFPSAARGVILAGEGEGTNTTYINITHNNTIIDQAAGSETPSAGTAITAGWTQMSSNVTVTSTSGLAVGDIVFCEQKINTNIMWSTDGLNARFLGHNAIILAINGSIITIWPPIQSELSPDPVPLMKHYSGARIEKCGIENLQIDASGQANVWGLLSLNTVDCWYTNVTMWGVANYFIYAINGVFNEFCHDNLFDSPVFDNNHGGFVIGNVGAGRQSGVAIYNNITRRILPGIEINGGTSAGIISYNLTVDTQNSERQAVGININHGPQNRLNLYEGNISNMMMSDANFGGSDTDTLLRNWLTGWSETYFDTNSMPLGLCKWSINYNVIGNVLGVTNFTPDSLMETNVDYGYEVSTVYYFGYPNGGNSGFTGVRPPSTDRVDAYDRNVTNTVLLHGNWNSKTKEIAWNAGITNRNIPSSYYLDEKPSWFGNRTWPVFNPYNGYTNLYLTDVPAGYRYIYGTNPPPGDDPVYPISGRSAGLSGTKVVVSGKATIQ